MANVIVITIVLCSLIEVSLAQYVYEVYQPELSTEQYGLGTYKTDFGTDARTVRSERSLLKKLLRDCVPCCQNNCGYNIGAPNSGYSDDYTENDSAYDSEYSGPTINPSPYGHIYLPFRPPRQRLFPNLFNRPFRVGGMGKKKLAAQAQEPVYEEPVPPPAPSPTYEASAPAYEAPAPSPVNEASQPTMKPKSTYSEKTDYETVEDVKPNAQQNNADSAESVEVQKNSYVSQTDYKEDKQSSEGLKAKTMPQVLQPIVYIYNVPSPSPMPTYSPPAPSYSPPAPSYSPTFESSYSPLSQDLYSPPALPYTLPSPPAMVFPETDFAYSPFDSYSSLLNPPNYYKRTYSQSLTYLLPTTASYATTQSFSYPDVDQPMRACPELFTNPY